MRDVLRSGALFWLIAGGAVAQDWTPDRFHLFYSNDSNAAPKLDRWRTVAVAGTWGFDRGPARNVSFQLSAEIIAPERLSPSGVPADRAFAGVYEAILRDRHELRWGEVHYGLGATLAGPQTGLSEFLDAAHEVLGGVPVSDFVADNQVPNAIYLEIEAGIAHSFELNSFAVRPFADLRSGVESYVRAGIDVSWPKVVRPHRMPVTGALMVDPMEGWSAGVGFDVTYVLASDLIPAGQSVTLKDTRLRARGQVSYGTGPAQVDFGLAWLGPEFDEQRSGQWIGTVGLSFSY